jgi:uncharacterized phage protein (TIGR01671 family)
MNIPKYRAWHKQLKLMMPVLEINLDPEHGGVFVVSKDGHYCGCRLNMELWPWSDIELLQYVGHDDAKGNEIYEGDLLKMESATAKVVFWGSPPEFGLDYYHNEDEWCEDWNLTDDSERMEVIGNIWGNSDLLPQNQSQPTE